MSASGHLYIFHGPEEFRRAEAVKELRAQLGDPSAVAMNTTELDGRSVSLSELIAAAGALPFMGERRLVIVDGLLARLEGRGGKGANKDDAELLKGLIDYLPRLSPATWLVFEEDRLIADKHPLLRAAAERKAMATVRVFGALGEGELRNWIKQRVKLKGGAFANDGLEALVAASENDLRLLEQEIEKLITYAGGRAVTAADVQKLVHGARSANVFAMVDALGQHNGRRALGQCHALLAEGEPPLRLLFMVTRQFRLILQAKDLNERRAPVGEMMRALGGKQFVVDKIMGQARLFSMAQLEAIYRRLLEVDRSIKTGQAEPVLALDTLIAEIASTPRAPHPQPLSHTWERGERPPHR
ncbi:MAG: DNA polymerase III subunit delta [Chloroflexi bacterium]|nr:DNA polymerase III subunit delta [Chloroflexota bacterium]